MLTGKKISFVLYNYPLGVSTMLINAISMLIEHHNEVIVITNNHVEKNIPNETWLKDLIVPIGDNKENANESSRFKQFSIRAIGYLGRVLLKIADKLGLYKPKWEIKNRALFNFSDALADILRSEKFDIIMAVECFSLIATEDALKTTNGHTELFYFDMELLDWAPHNPLYSDKLELKRRQFKALEKVSRVIITSFNRAKLFSNINEYPEKQISVLPVVPREREIKSKSNYFQDKFDIGSGKTVVIYSGNFMPWAECLEIINSMKSWPQNSVLVMHTWNKASLRSKYFRKMVKAANGYPVFFSSDYLSYEELGLVLTSADIGLLYYSNIDDNFSEIFLSSNKMGEYIASGLPLICSPFPSLKAFVDKQDIGRAVSVKELGNAVKEISSNLQYFRGRVKECCDEYFVFDKYFQNSFEAL